MKRFVAMVLAGGCLAASLPLWAEARRIDVCDSFTLPEPAGWRVKVERELPLRFADVRVDAPAGYPFGLMLYFKCDTPDLAQFDSPEKIERTVRVSSEKYLPGVVERSVVLQRVPLTGNYGFFTVLTDASLVRKKELAPGEYRYLTRGMFRVSRNVALGFSLMTNDVDSPEYQKRLEYVFGFARSGE